MRILCLFCLKIYLNIKKKPIYKQKTQKNLNQEFIFIKTYLTHFPSLQILRGYVR